jgi:hypothetical protein
MMLQHWFGAVPAGVTQTEPSAQWHCASTTPPAHWKHCPPMQSSPGRQLQPLSPTQTPFWHVLPEVVQSWQVPDDPQAWLSVPGRQVPPAQQPLWQPQTPLVQHPPPGHAVLLTQVPLEQQRFAWAQETQVPL